jgi:hypothetical protein
MNFTISSDVNRCVVVAGKKRAWLDAGECPDAYVSQIAGKNRSWRDSARHADLAEEYFPQATTYRRQPADA